MYREAISKPCSCLDKGFKLILMDIQMPVMGGIEASEKILRISPCKIVALTSYTATAMHKKCLAVGMKEVFTKPVVYAKLKQILDKYYN